VGVFILIEIETLSIKKVKDVIQKTINFNRFGLCFEF